MKLTNLLLCGVISACVGLTTCTTEKQDTPFMSVPMLVNGDNTSINGGYVFKHTEDLGAYFSGDLYDSDIEIDFLTLGTSTYQVYVNDPRNQYMSFNTMVDPYLFTATYYAEDDLIRIEFILTEGETEPTYIEIGSGDNIQDINFNVNLDLSCFGFATNSVGFLSRVQRILFNVIFATEVTSNFFYYSGWYTFSNSSQYNQRGYGSVVCSLTFDNQLYDSLFIAPSYYSVSRTVISSNGNVSGDSVTIMQRINNVDTWNTSARNIYFSSAMLSRTSYENLLKIGVFNYVQMNPQEYTMTDLFIDIADTPIRFIVDLFSFELFGMQVSIAFMGIITAMAMIFIVRKFL